MRKLRNKLAATAAFVAVMSSTWAIGGLWVSRTIGNETRVEAAANQFFMSEEGQQLLTTVISDATGNVLGEQRDQIVAGVVKDPRVTETAKNGFMSVYKGAKNGQEPVALDTKAISDSLVDQARTVYEGPGADWIAGALATTPPEIRLPAAPGPLTWALSDGPLLAFKLGGLLACAMASTAFIVAYDRDRILRKFGKYLLVTGVITGLIVYVLPMWLLGKEGFLAFLGILLKETTGAMIAVAALELAAGIGMLGGSYVVKRNTEQPTKRTPPSTTAATPAPTATIAGTAQLKPQNATSPPKRASKSLRKKKEPAGPEKLTDPWGRPEHGQWEGRSDRFSQP